MSHLILAFDSPWWVITAIAVAAALRVWWSAAGYLRKYRASLLELADSALIALLLVFCILRPFVIQAFYIPSGSMKPTLLVNDRILVNKFIYFFKEPKVGDIVVFRAPVPAVQPGEKKDFIKRVVGLSGDRLEVHGGKLYRNGAPVDEPWLVTRKDDTLQHDNKPPEPAPPGLDISSSERELTPEGPFESNVPDYDWPSRNYPAPGPDGTRITSGDFTVPPGTILVMGDNRTNSDDGHIWGPLVRENLLGKAMFIFWPLSRVQVLH
jgi:signal peptidase I